MARSIHTADSEQLLEAMPDAVVMVSTDGRVVRVNGRAESLSGYSREELVGLAIEDLVPEALQSAHVAHRTAYQRKPTVRSMGTHLDIRFRRKDGSEFPADIALSPVLTEQGVLIVAAVRDITERRRAEEELLQTQEGFRLVVEGVRDYAILMLDPEGRVSTWSRGAARLEGYEAGEIIGCHFSTFYPEADLAAGKPARDLAAAADAGRYEEEGWRVRKDGSRFWANVVITAISDHAGKLLGFAEITRDVTERKRQDDRLQAVLEVAQATLEGGREEELLRLIAQRARALVESALSMVVLPDPDGETLTIAAGDGQRADAILGSQVPLAGSVTGQVLANGRPLVLDEWPSASGARASVVAGGRIGPLLAVRLASGDRVLGALLVSNEPGGGRFTDSDRRLVELFAAQAAVAIAYTRVRDDLQRLAVLEDRERIGRELHDGAIQELFAVGMGLQGMAIMATDPALRGRLEATVGQVDEVIRDLRNYIFGLRPGLVADRHLTQAMQDLAEQLERQHGVACAVEVDQAVAARLAGRAADIVQLAREALSNVGRHASAATCRLSLRGEPGFAMLEVEDDGRGFVPGEDGEGWGLRNLEERAAALGGSLDIASAPGEGTTVRLRIPT
ncbi:MAG TPA: PAS domain S-box protein [Candidatus Dormibacteraeota bacterium]|nr:PAS domain S-box protein [Candidatus Dormibacteraeota bacterium]